MDGLRTPLEVLRREKRVLLQNERQLKAMRDVERTNARTAQILAQKEKQQQERLDRLEVEVAGRRTQRVAVCGVEHLVGGTRSSSPPGLHCDRSGEGDKRA